MYNYKSNNNITKCNRNNNLNSWAIFSTFPFFSPTTRYIERGCRLEASENTLRGGEKKAGRSFERE